VLAYCLMPNHFHLVLWPYGGGDLSRSKHWLMTTHVRRFLKHDRGSGHVWQGRFKALPIQEDEHLRVVLRYVERNGLRAALVQRTEQRPWSSLARAAEPPLLDPGPAPRGAGWVEVVNAPMTEAECQAIAESIRRSRPLGAEAWVNQTARDLGLRSSLRNAGRPP
jgi:putative transposase